MSRFLVGGIISLLSFLLGYFLGRRAKKRLGGNKTPSQITVKRTVSLRWGRR